MNTIHLYHLSDNFMGSSIELIPRIPESASLAEDNYTPRICCSITIPGCFLSKEVSYSLKSNNDYLEFYLYSADVPVENIYQPSIVDVPDTWSNGEFWVMKPQKFEYITKYRIRKQLELSDEYCYSRYACTAHAFDEVVDRYSAQPIYGDMNAFSYIEFDAYRYKNKMRELDVKIPVLKQISSVKNISSEKDLFQSLNEKEES